MLALLLFAFPGAAGAGMDAFIRPDDLTNSNLAPIPYPDDGWGLRYFGPPLGEPQPLAPQYLLLDKAADIYLPRGALDIFLPGKAPDRRNIDFDRSEETSSSAPGRQDYGDDAIGPK